MTIPKSVSLSAWALMASLSISSADAALNGQSSVVKVANVICASPGGSIEASLGAMGSDFTELSATSIASAFGDAARQAGQDGSKCKSTPKEIKDAFDAWKAAHPGPGLDEAYAVALNSGNGGQGQGVGGLTTSNTNPLIVTTTVLAPGEAPSDQ
jgi:hypothetical protein